MSTFLACGVWGPSLDREERRLLEELLPGGVVLFGRNVRDRAQLSALTAELRELPSHPYVAVDLEGGRVNRLEPLVGSLPSPAEAARAGMPAVRALGRAVGAICAHFGITLDFAPVLDVARRGGWLGAESRCFGASAAEVQGAAKSFLVGLESFGVAGCLKHYPGLGSGRVDSHRELPTLDDGVVEDAKVFHELAEPQRAVMVAHALAPALGERTLPASLSAQVIGTLPIERCGPVLADDLEMGALRSFGTLPERAVAALAAGCDQVLVCNALHERRAVAEWVARQAKNDSSLAARLVTSETHLGSFAREAPPEVPWPLAVELVERAHALTLAGGGA
ncbi:MAG: glycoside hydrolase family 3 N-terminal domain-containing protein [Thermoanaerobaculales bacterium]